MKRPDDQPELPVTSHVHGLRSAPGFSELPDGYTTSDLSMTRRTEAIRSIEDAKPFRTLVVDDAPILLEVMSEYLRSLEGIEVVGEARDGWEALEKARNLSPDLVLMDIRMPGLNGLEVTRRIKKRAPETRVVLATILDSKLVEKMSRQSGADGFVTKSRLTRNLVSLIGSLFSGKFEEFLRGRSSDRRRDRGDDGAL